MDAIFSQIPDVYIITDDILIGSKTLARHDRAIQQIITAYMGSGVHLNGDKHHLLNCKIKFFGQVMLKDNVSGNPEITKVLTDMLPSTNMSYSHPRIIQVSDKVHEYSNFHN